MTHRSRRGRDGLVDEMRVHLVPVLLGASTRLLDDTRPHIRLERPTTSREPKATHLGYRVINNA